MALYPWSLFLLGKSQLKERPQQKKRMELWGIEFCCVLVWAKSGFRARPVPVNSLPSPCRPSISGGMMALLLFRMVQTVGISGMRESAGERSFIIAQQLFKAAADTN